MRTGWVSDVAGHRGIGCSLLQVELGIVLVRLSVTAWICLEER